MEEPVTLSAGQFAEYEWYKKAFYRMAPIIGELTHEFIEYFRNPEECEKCGGSRDIVLHSTYWKVMRSNG